MPSLDCDEITVLWPNDNFIELEASLAPAEAEIGAVAKADQKGYSMPH